MADEDIEFDMTAKPASDGGVIEIHRDPGLVVFDLAGLGQWWHEYDRPFWLHRCRPTTLALGASIGVVERCPCGAVRLNGGSWFERNTRPRK